MTHAEKRTFLIQYLLQEQSLGNKTAIPQSEADQKRMLRALINIRLPKPIGADFLQIQDEYLQEEIAAKGITDFSALSPIEEEMYVWQGDITTLRCDAIVNAANRQMLGCFCPCHGCIDNAIHTYAGVELRLECAEMMEKQGYAEPTGKAKMTRAYNLPCKFIVHTVGPIIEGNVTEKDETLLTACYRSCLALAEQNGVKSIAFCCISTGEFHFPNRRAAEIAIRTVKNYKKQTNSKIEVIFNVFKDLDYDIYRELLG